MRYLGYCIAGLVAIAIVYVFAPVMVLFARDGEGKIDNNNGTGIEPRLPAWLEWASTVDNSLLGDAGHKARWAGQSRYLQMVTWMWRNPAYVFASDRLGARYYPFMIVEYTGDPSIKNRDNAVEGVLGVVLRDQVEIYWCVKRVWRIGRTSRCLMTELGWKLQPYAQALAKSGRKAGRLDADWRNVPARAAWVLSIRLTEFKTN